MRNVMIFLAALGLMTSLAATKSATAGTTTFDNGIEGWGVFYANESGLGDFLESSGGNPGAHLRWNMVDTFGCTFRNDSNADTIGDYSRWAAPVQLRVDLKVEHISFFGTPVARNLIVELVDFNEPSNPYPWTSVWYNLGEISAAQTANWTTFEIVIADPTSVMLPAGWGGTGDEDPVTFEPRLPPGRTFASVLASVEEIRFTTLEPGYFYGFTDFELRFDNPTVQPMIAAIGDLNCDGSVNNFDIDPFVLAISDAAAYEAAYPNCDVNNADINDDGLVNNFDIDSFVTCVTNGACP